jgi:membrane fusion protein (multidrug efflux system)
MRIKLLLVVAACALVGWVGYKAFGGGAAPRNERGAATVTVEEATLTMVEDRIEALGTTIANESVDITAQVTEMVGSILFTDGALVKAGDTLVELGKAETLAELQDARSNLTEQQKQYDRAVQLVKSGAATNSRLDTQTAALKSARARVAAAEARLNNRIIKAPFDGVVGLRRVSPGTLVQPGTVMTTLDDVRIIKLDFAVPEPFLAEIQTGLVLQARSAAYPGRVFEGRVASVDTRLDTATRSLIVRAEIPNPDMLLRPGMLMVVEVKRNPREAILVPEQAVSALQDRKFVFVMDSEDKAQRKEVQTGVRRNGRIEITQGLAVGDRVVVEGGFKLRPGAGAVIVPALTGGEGV